MLAKLCFSQPRLTQLQRTTEYALEGPVTIMGWVEVEGAGGNGLVISSLFTSLYIASSFGMHVHLVSYLYYLLQ